MKLKLKDLLATILFAAIAVPYVGYLINGEMPFIKDPPERRRPGWSSPVSPFSLCAETTCSTGSARPRPRGHPPRRRPPDRAGVPVGTGMWRGAWSTSPLATSGPLELPRTQLDVILVVASRRLLHFHNRPDDQPERCADDQAEGHGGNADHQREHGSDRRA
jgi:hypothetical protein